jgi:hypothetical protein
MQAPEHNLPVTMTQVIVWLRQCSTQEKKALLKVLLDDTAALTIASEQSLATDWSSEEEDEVWKDL